MIAIAVREMSLSTERAVSVTCNSDSTENLLMDLSPPEVLVDSSDATNTGVTLTPGALGPPASPVLGPLASSMGPTSPGLGLAGAAAAARLHKQLRPMLTAPSFDQRPPDLHDSPWSSTETPYRSHENSTCLPDNAGGVGGVAATYNNNTLAIGIESQLRQTHARSAPPSQSSVDSGSHQNRSVPDIELHYRRGNSDERVCVISGENPRLYNRRTISHHHHPNWVKYLHPPLSPSFSLIF